MGGNEVVPTVVAVLVGAVITVSAVVDGVAGIVASALVDGSAIFVPAPFVDTVVVCGVSPPGDSSSTRSARTVGVRGAGTAASDWPVPQPQARTTRAQTAPAPARERARCAPGRFFTHPTVLGAVSSGAEPSAVVRVARVPMGQTESMPVTVVDCTDLEGELRFLTEQVGFRVALVSPADHPRRIVVEYAGTEVELRRAPVDRPTRLWIERGGPAAELYSPGGSVVEFGPATDEIVLPPNRPTLTVVDGSSGDFGLGRAGMRYRDLLPDRWGGRFIASHIRIDDEGDVADWVHFHRIRFQMIFVVTGWVDVVYEDQGDPFRMSAGDCVLQPPEIRHRVLRSSAGFEVIEIGCPAEHDTLADHDLELPTAAFDAERDFSGQRFVRHVAASASTVPWVDTALEARDTGVAAATGGLADAVVVSSSSTATGMELVHDGEFLLVVGLGGHGELDVGERSVQLDSMTSIAIPPGLTWCWSAHSSDHSALLVSLPAESVRPR